MARDPKHNAKPSDRSPDDAAVVDRVPAADALPPAVWVDRWWVALLLLFSSALLMGLAFPRPGWWGLAHVALVPGGYLAIRTRKPRTAAVAAYVIAFGWWLIMLRWLIPVTGPGWAGLCAYMAVYAPAAFLLLRLLHKHLRLPATFALPLIVVSLDLVRRTALSGGFGWFALGHTMANFHPDQGPGRLVQVADLFGESAVTLLVAMTNGLLIDLWLRKLWRNRETRKPALAFAGAWALLFLAALGYGQWRIGQFDTATTPGPTVAVVQTNIPQSNKLNPTPEQVAADWQRLLELTAAAANLDPKPQLIVWPETSAPAALNPESLEFFPRSRSSWRGREVFHESIAQNVPRWDAHLLVGAHAMVGWDLVPTPDGEGFYEMPADRYNAAYLYRPTGQQDPARYDKIHRVPFGEYTPWVDAIPGFKAWFLQYLTPYDYDYSLTAGTRWMRFDIPAEGVEGDLSFAVPICFEDAVPRVTRRLTYPADEEEKTDLLVNISNDGWFVGTSQNPQHLQIAAMRTVENRVPMARSVNTGVSGFIDSIGRVGPLVERDGLTQAVEGAAAQRVLLDRRRTLYGAVGNAPAWVVAAATGVLVVVGLVRRRRVARVHS